MRDSLGKGERWSPLCLSPSLQSESLSLSSFSSPVSPSLSLSLVPGQTKAASVRRTQGALAKLKPDSSCLSTDHRLLIQPSPQTSQVQIQINTLQLSPPPPAPSAPPHWCGFSHFRCTLKHFSCVTLTSRAAPSNPKLSLEHFSKSKKLSK